MCGILAKNNGKKIGSFLTLAKVFRETVHKKASAISRAW